MNNTQKAEQIANKYSFEYEDETSIQAECENSALEMAEWKDAQFIKFLEDRIGNEILVKTIDEFKKLINDK